MRCEYAHIAHFFIHTEITISICEKTLDTLWRNCFQLLVGITPDAGFAYCGSTEIGGKYLNGCVVGLASLDLKQYHGDGISFFACCTGRYPYTQRLSRFFSLK